MKILKNEGGFTLIELVVVIVILGVLAAIAVPKYLDMRAEAEKGVANGVTAALRGAIAIRHARYLMDPVTTQAYNGTIIAAAIQTEDVTVTGTTAVITAAFPSGNTYTWTYTDASTTDTIPAIVTKGW